jgi:hypothetical protein
MAAASMIPQLVRDRRMMWSGFLVLMMRMAVGDGWIQ